jgi:hypothetical protein
MLRRTWGRCLIAGLLAVVPAGCNYKVRSSDADAKVGPGGKANDPLMAGVGAEEKKAIAAIAKNGGHVALNDRTPEQRNLIASFNTEATDDMLADLRNLTGLQKVELKGSKVTDAGLLTLKDIGSLQALDLRDTGITDAGLTHLHDMPNLTSLMLAGTKVTEEGVDALKKANAKLKRIYWPGVMPY